MNRLLRALRTLMVLIVVSVALLAVVYYVPDPGGDAPRVLVSVDKTLWNRIGLNRYTYVRALRKEGLSPVLVDYGMLGSPEAPSASLDGAAGLVLTGGGDVAPERYGAPPEIGHNVKTSRDEFEVGLLAAAESLGLPVLGLCRGAQLMNVHRGGTLGEFRGEAARYQRHLRLTPGHPVRLAPDSRLAGVYGQTRLRRVVTWHGQHVEAPGRGVRIVAWTEDGTPEAIEVSGDSEFGMIGVQWHAEMPPGDEVQARLFAAFANAVAEYDAASDARQASTNASKIRR